MATKYCQVCSGHVDKLTFPMRGNVCVECEVTYGLGITTKKGRVSVMGRETQRKDWHRAFRGSGHYPLTFNFLFVRNDRYVQCSYCGTFVHEKKLTRDHVYPKSKGGLIKTPACMNCNVAKEDMLPIVWAIHSYDNGLDLAVIPIGVDWDLDEEEIDEAHAA